MHELLSYLPFYVSLMLDANECLFDFLMMCKSVIKKFINRLCSRVSRKGMELEGEQVK